MPVLGCGTLPEWSLSLIDSGTRSNKRVQLGFKALQSTKLFRGRRNFVQRRPNKKSSLSLLANQGYAEEGRTAPNDFKSPNLSPIWHD